mmetsp:Transcript_8303/g.16906  ORF Transcript_8303/g.16906 Transcript_8303/m.16906 type:complete len:223 (+) Transcript_8303:1018-1686(+)
MKRLLAGNSGKTRNQLLEHTDGFVNPQPVHVERACRVHVLHCHFRSLGLPLVPLPLILLPLARELFRLLSMAVVERVRSLLETCAHHGVAIRCPLPALAVVALRRAAPRLQLVATTLSSVRGGQSWLSLLLHHHKIHRVRQVVDRLVEIFSKIVEDVAQERAVAVHEEVAQLLQLTSVLALIHDLGPTGRILACHCRSCGGSRIISWRRRRRGNILALVVQI